MTSPDAGKAAEETGKTTEKPAETAAVVVPEPPKTQNEAKPELDTVRVESDGQAIVAGRAEPGAEVSLKLGDKVLGKGIANADGSWVVVPDNPLPKGAHELTVEQRLADAAPVTSDKSITVAIPEKAGQQAMVALTEPGAATKVLQAAGNEAETPVQTAEAVPAAPEAAAPEAPAGKAVETQKTTEVTQTPPAAEAPPGATKAVPEVPAETGDGGTAPAEKPAETAALEVTKAPEAQSPAGAAPAQKAQVVPLRLDAVDYNDKGDIIFSGRATPGTAIRLYVDNGAVGDAIVDSLGNWSFRGSDIIAPGTHNLRADQIDTAGKVIARIELPFQREDATAVAALNAETQVPKAAPDVPASEVTKTEPEASGATVSEPPAVQAPEAQKETVTAAAPTTETKSTEPDKPRSGKVVIQPGNNLWKLSRVIYGRGINFTVIYDANKEQIRNPDLIYPGQIFAIPNATPPESIDPKRKDPLTSAEGGAAQ